MPNKKRKEKLSIYLAKSYSDPDSELLKIDQADFPIQLEVAEAESAMLYIKKNLMFVLLHGQSYLRLTPRLPKMSLGIVVVSVLLWYCSRRAVCL